MERRRNLLPLVGLLVCVVALVSYPTFFVRFPMTRDVRWASWLLFALGFAILGGGLVRAVRRPDLYRWRIVAPAFSVLGVVVLGFFVFLTEVSSRWLPTSSEAPQIGEPAPDFTLPDATGRPVRLSSLLAPGEGRPNGTWALLIFYRGYW